MSGLGLIPHPNEISGDLRRQESVPSTRVQLGFLDIWDREESMRFAKKDWGEALRSAVSSGAVTAVATAGSVSLAGVHDTGSAVAPINATSHMAWGESAADFEGIRRRKRRLGNRGR